MARRNPSKFDRCVKQVKTKGAVDPYAVCTAAGTRGNRKKRKNLVPLTEVLSAGQYAEQGRKLIAKKLKFNGKKKRSRQNPADQAAQTFEDFHGRASSETIVVPQKIHFHENLAAAGVLVALDILPSDGGGAVDMDFDDEDQQAILAMNERGTQLFIVAPYPLDEVVDEYFELQEPIHEKELLGLIRQVDYFTVKDHLGDEGGEAIYQHKFKRPYPSLVYDTVNKHLEVVGGSYVILPEGIDD